MPLRPISLRALYSSRTAAPLRFIAAANGEVGRCWEGAGRGAMLRDAAVGCSVFPREMSENNRFGNRFCCKRRAGIRRVAAFRLVEYRAVEKNPMPGLPNRSFFGTDSRKSVISRGAPPSGGGGARNAARAKSPPCGALRARPCLYDSWRQQTARWGGAGGGPVGARRRTRRPTAGR